MPVAAVFGLIAEAHSVDHNLPEPWPALANWLAKAQAQGLMGPGDPAVMAAHFLAILWGGLLNQLLLRVRDAPSVEEIESRAHAATRALLTLYAPARAAPSGASL